MTRIYWCLAMAVTSLLLPGVAFSQYGNILSAEDALRQAYGGGHNPVTFVGDEDVERARHFATHAWSLTNRGTANLSRGDAQLFQSRIAESRGTARDSIARLREYRHRIQELRNTWQASNQGPHLDVIENAWRERFGANQWRDMSAESRRQFMSADFSGMRTTLNQADRAIAMDIQALQILEANLEQTSRTLATLAPAQPVPTSRPDDILPPRGTFYLPSQSTIPRTHPNGIVFPWQEQTWRYGFEEAHRRQGRRVPAARGRLGIVSSLAAAAASLFPALAPGRGHATESPSGIEFQEPNLHIDVEP
jgi:hypothetical protein